MVNFNKCCFTIKYFFFQCFEIVTFRTKPKDDEDENKYKSINEYDINEDDINNFIIIDNMIR
jgi:hypothetical protein